MRRSNHFYRTWRYVLIRTLPVLLIPMIALLYVCDVSINRIIATTYESQLQTLRSGAAKAERVLNNAADLILYLENESDAKQFFASIGPINNGEATLDFIDLQNNMHSLIVSNSLFSNIQMYSHKSCALIDGSTIALIPSRYYEHVFQMDSVDYSDWAEQYLNGEFNLDVIPAQRCVFYSKEDRFIIVAHSYPTGYSRYSTGNIFIFINEKTLLENAFDASAVDDGLLWAVNAQGECIFKNQSDFSLADYNGLSGLTDDHGYVTLSTRGQSLLLVYTTDAQYGLRYFAAIPTEQVLTPTLRIRTTITALMAMVVVAGLAMIAVCSARVSRPVSKLYDLIAPSREAVSFDDLSANVSSLISQNENLQDQISQQNDHYRMALFYEMLLGNTGGDTSPEDYRRILGIEREHGTYVVMTVVLNDLGEYSEESLGVKMYVREALEKKLPEILALYDWGIDKFALLMNIDNDSTDQIKKTVNGIVGQLVDSLLSHFTLSLTFFADICDSLDTISLAFHHTLAMLQRTDRDVSSIVQWHCPTIDGAAVFSYPIEIESQLISSALDGNTSMVEKCFDEIAANSQKAISVSSGASSDLLLALRSTWLRLCSDREQNFDEFPVVTLIDDCLANHGDINECLANVRACFVNVAHAGNQRAAELTENQRQIKAYVDNNYANPAISLIMVADAFHISEVYLSKLFKQITGENFSKYIEQLRMERANQLLEEKKPIKDVAIEVGYNSPQVFRRAYKRLYGVSPSDKNN